MSIIYTAMKKNRHFFIFYIKREMFSFFYCFCNMWECVCVKCACLHTIDQQIKIQYRNFGEHF